MLRGAQSLSLSCSVVAATALSPSSDSFNTNSSRHSKQARTAFLEGEVAAPAVVEEDADADDDDEGEGGGGAAELGGGAAVAMLGGAASLCRTACAAAEEGRGQQAEQNTSPHTRQ